MKKKIKKAKKIKILLIDDEKDLIDIYKAKFKAKDFRVFCARSGKDGIEIALKRKPDIILSDVVMPKGDGFYVLEKLQKNEEIKKIPIVVFTQLDSKDDQREIMKRGATDYLVKVKHTPAQVVRKILDTLKKNKK